MTATITYVNGSTLPRTPHHYIVGSGPCAWCGAAEDEIHRRLGCEAEVCPQCRAVWSGCACRTVDVIPRHGRLKGPRLVGTVQEYEDAEGRAYTMRVEEDEE